ncbi:MAG: DNA alkylation repair protein [Chloroflexi bacterium AL-W]|nr:DNA alkylation repair protein [Chloroflexi bacterium AL-N1]NOK65637.1 DNA alkylation repair protein [Chloroflexi bacterium AL-N10]NOK74422.1 DNA alkylation repair protein [Chloroflexi bacterium AL-N5]NOK80670.1 DNA alkylation repair protein [Chloroflexi bacterium AL-W]NOK88680.1 DNA alkylation repair protein [Chloroflexi bacterium AL-N15]
MQRADILDKIQSLSDPRAIAAWSRVGAGPDQYLGTNLTRLKELAKSIKKSHELALELWDSGIHDAKLLATMIERPKKVTSEQIDTQMEQVYTVDLADKYCSNIIARTSFVQEKIDLWRQSEVEMKCRSSYMLIAAQAKQKRDLPDAYFEQILQTIEQRIQQEQNWVKEAMNYALIAIGSRNKHLNHLSVAMARRVGIIEVDYGMSACQAPNALTKLTAQKLMQGLV